MFKYNNTHIFTGYLKQYLSSFNLPTCKIYTQEFAKYLARYGKEDPRVLESFNTIDDSHLSVRINYLKNNELYNYYSTNPSIVPVLNKDGTNALDKDGKEVYERDYSTCSWQTQNAKVFYDGEKATRGLTRTLSSRGGQYDTITHEYLGDYLRFLRDYYNINLMSLYNCFNDKIYNNVYYSCKVNTLNKDFDANKEISTENPKYIESESLFNSQDANYRIYAIPVKLFSEYTIALDCDRSIELFCGFYSTNLDVSEKSEELATKTYLKVNKTLFKQPFLYDKLSVVNWPASNDFDSSGSIRTDTFTRWDITNREKDLRLFIKVPTSCKSSITILEGDFRGFNDSKYAYKNNNWVYSQNHSVINFNTSRIGVEYTTLFGDKNFGDGIDLNNYSFKPISKLQLLAFNTGESYPFADRLIEYLSGSVITPLDSIPDNIKRAQKVMNQNKYYFKIDGLWEAKMQNILYDYLMSSGPIKLTTVRVCDDKNDERYNKEVDSNYTGPTKQKQILKDSREGYHKKLGHTSKSTLYDILGYGDKDAEKLYASWKKENNNVQIKDNIQNVDIYVDPNGKSLWDI